MTTWEVTTYAAVICGEGRILWYTESDTPEKAEKLAYANGAENFVIQEIGLELKEE